MLRFASPIDHLETRHSRGRNTQNSSKERNSPQFWKQMLYKIPDLVFWDNFCSTYNAVSVKVMVGYQKEFKILVNPARSIEYCGVWVSEWLIQHWVLALTHHLHNCQNGNIIVMSVSQKRAHTHTHKEKKLQVY